MAIYGYFSFLWVSEIMEKYFCLFEETLCSNTHIPLQYIFFCMVKKIWELCREKLTRDYLVIYILHQLLLESEKTVFLKSAAEIPSYF